MASSLGTDWSQPGAVRVADGVHRIPVPLPLRGLAAVNVYVIESTAGPVLIDPGWSGAQPRAALELGMRELGFGLDDVSQILVTHAHWDHYLQAVILQRDLGTTIGLGGGEEESVTAFGADDGRLYPHQLPQLRRAGAPELADRLAERAPDAHERDVPYGLPDRWLTDGETVDVDGGSLEIITTPGHTHGHVVIRHQNAGLVFTGDHLLPAITPAVGYEHCPQQAPLADYLESLTRTQTLHDLTMAPAHGMPGGSVSQRSEEMIAHHDVRLAEIADYVRAGDSTAAAIATEMRWTSRRRQLGEIEITHQMTAILEVDAHLEVLRRQGVVTAVDRDGVQHFEPTH